MTIATCTNEDLTEKEDEHVCVRLRRPQGGVKNGQRRRGKEDQKGHGARVVIFLTPTLLSLGYYLEGIITNSFPRVRLQVDG